eukprot:scaffold5988_cov381-Prasinococcus_capsulatus_cf.AAC.18
MPTRAGRNRLDPSLHGHRSEDSSFPSPPPPGGSGARLARRGSRPGVDRPLAGPRPMTPCGEIRPDRDLGRYMPDCLARPPAWRPPRPAPRGG